MEYLLVSTEGTLLHLPFPPSFTPFCKRPLSTLKFTKNHSCNASILDLSSPLVNPKPDSLHKSSLQHQEYPYTSEARQKVAYLESIGVDSYSAVAANSAISTATLDSIQTVVKFLYRMGIPQEDLGRLFACCPNILTASISQQLKPVFTFLAREVKIPPRYLRRAIHRRPRLLECSVKDQLRPTLYFLQRLGFTQVNKCFFLLTCSVEMKLIPRLEYVQSLGVSYDEAVGMFLKFPALFNYSVDDNLRPKWEYLANDMGRSVDELLVFPQYFGYGLEKRIRPRHRILVENGVHGISLFAMLKPTDKVFLKNLKGWKTGAYSDFVM